MVWSVCACTAGSMRKARDLLRKSSRAADEAAVAAAGQIEPQQQNTESAGNRRHAAAHCYVYSFCARVKHTERRGWVVANK